MTRYGRGMRDCCDSLAQPGVAHIAGCSRGWSSSPAPAMTPPSANDYAAAVVATQFGRRRARRCYEPADLRSLIALAYDAGVLAQQRFAEKTDV